jgi:hypothetical protein
MDIHERSDAAVHAQWLTVVTLIELVPPGAPNESDAADNTHVQGGRIGCVEKSLSLQTHRAVGRTQCD